MFRKMLLISIISTLLIACKTPEVENENPTINNETKIQDSDIKSIEEENEENVNPEEETSEEDDALEEENPEIEKALANVNEIVYDEKVAEYRNKTDLAAICVLNEQKIPDLTKMDLYTFTFQYPEDGGPEKFIIFPRYEDSTIEVFSVSYNAETSELDLAERAMYTHKMKDNEVFLLSTLIPETVPNIAIKLSVQDLSAVWIPKYNGIDGSTIIDKGFSKTLDLH